MTLNSDDGSASPIGPDRPSLPTPSRLETLQHAAAISSRPLLSQGAGMVGLLWCLFDDHPLVATVLALLVLADQMLFLRGRFGPHGRQVPFQTGLNLWCLGVSAVDLLIYAAVLFRAAGLRAMPAGTPVSEPMDFLAYALATVLHTGSDLAPATASGRLLAIAVAAIGAALLFAAAVRAGLWIARRTDGSETGIRRR